MEEEKTTPFFCIFILLFGCRKFGEALENDTHTLVRLLPLSLSIPWSHFKICTFQVSLELSGLEEGRVLLKC